MHRKLLNPDCPKHQEADICLDQTITDIFGVIGNVGRLAKFMEKIYYFCIS